MDGAESLTVSRVGGADEETAVSNTGPIEDGVMVWAGVGRDITLESVKCGRFCLQFGSGDKEDASVGAPFGRRGGMGQGTAGPSVGV